MRRGTERVKEQDEQRAEGIGHSAVHKSPLGLVCCRDDQVRPLFGKLVFENLELL